MLLCDFNSETAMIEFCIVDKMKNLVKGVTWSQNPEKSSCNDLILTNRPKSFQVIGISFHIIKSGLSDFHRMTVTFMKMYFKTQEPIIIHCRNYKIFNTQHFCYYIFAILRWNGSTRKVSCDIQNSVR